MRMKVLSLFSIWCSPLEILCDLSQKAGIKECVFHIMVSIRYTVTPSIIIDINLTLWEVKHAFLPQYSSVVKQP